MLENKKLEQAIIGTILADPVSFSGSAKDHLVPELFYFDSSRTLAQAVNSIWAKGMSPDMFETGRYMEDYHTELFNKFGGISWLADLVSQATSRQSQLTEWIAELNELAAKRTIQSICTETIAKLNAKSAGSQLPLEEYISPLENISQTVYSNGISKAISLPMPQVLDEHHNQPASPLLEHHHHLLDHYYKHCGSRRGQYELIMGDPGHGKSHFTMLRVACYLKAGHKALWIQREDTQASTAFRAKSYLKAIQAPESVQQNLFISDRLIYISDIKREARLRHAEGNLDVLVVDYIQRVKAGAKFDRRGEVDHISNELADMATELGILVLCVSQLRRRTETGWRAKPRLADLKESSQLEQDAFVVTSVFYPDRAGLRIGDSQNVEWKGDGATRPANTVLISLLKHRHGLPNSYEMEMKFSTDGTLQDPGVRPINASAADDNAYSETYNWMDP